MVSYLMGSQKPIGYNQDILREDICEAIGFFVSFLKACLRLGYVAQQYKT